MWPWRRHVAKIAVLVAVFAVTTAAANTVREAAAEAAPTPGQLYYLQNVTTGLRVQVASGSTAAGAAIVQGTASATTTQAHWRFAPVEGTSFYQIVNRRSGLCMDAGAASVRVVIRQSSCVNLPTFTHWTVGTAGTNHTMTGRRSGQGLCVIGDLNLSNVPLVSDVTPSCDYRFTLIPV
ncbi:hypothetical protein Val02_10090 [Virgisporangium aliadipatigenens]|uniref:Ricin B lectin domain-containing protein n=2 Tax=Virgisporangium aliadipatigenens TaxID=741659 RepID=A0A8J3YHN2_9ACTN|nr:hypothetical protein Val02_10090 [Virgisporangium aliadipatigenens]